MVTPEAVIMVALAEVDTAEAEVDITEVAVDTEVVVAVADTMEDDKSILKKSPDNVGAFFYALEIKLQTTQPSFPFTRV